MSTTMPKAQNITRKWYVIDAADKPLGRTAAKAADLLRGKHKPIFAPHVDCGDHVIIINAAFPNRSLEFVFSMRDSPFLFLFFLYSFLASAHLLCNYIVAPACFRFYQKC